MTNDKSIRSVYVLSTDKESARDYVYSHFDCCKTLSAECTC